MIAEQDDTRQRVMTNVMNSREKHLARWRGRSTLCGLRMKK